MANYRVGDNEDSCDRCGKITEIATIVIEDGIVWETLCENCGPEEEEEED